MPLVSLIYASTATHKLSRQEIIDILDKSREKNKQLGITGLLLYKDGNFMQVLEGEDKAVSDLYEAIEADPRHVGTHVMLKRPVDERTFGDWQMAFVDLDEVDTSQLEGYSDFLETPLNQIQDGSLAYTFLNTFKSIIV
ncbi:MAG: hypothetical protein CL607_22415 [Anaerolineaceae bacterium]|nr:hypothetical protein [Anaerolineaceae bacterium]